METRLGFVGHVVELRCLVAAVFQQGDGEVVVFVMLAIVNLPLSASEINMRILYYKRNLPLAHECNAHAHYATMPPPPSSNRMEKNELLLRYQFSIQVIHVNSYVALFCLKLVLR